MAAEDRLRMLHERRDEAATPTGYDLVVDGISLPACALSISESLVRIADALEQRNRIDEAMADFAAMLQRGAPAEDVELAPDGLPRQRR